MLYTQGKGMDFFVREGCKVMIYGWDFDEIKEILDEMVLDKTIEFNGGIYTLPLKGIFNVKKSTIVPLLNLTENQAYVEAFLNKNRENCDYIFLNEVASHTNDANKESAIIAYAKNNYDKLATILSLISQFSIGGHHF